MKRSGLARIVGVSLPTMYNWCPVIPIDLDRSTMVDWIFLHVHLDNDWIALMMIRLLNQRGPWLLALERTYWKVGTPIAIF